ncbi:MAG: hypothetical protein HQK62_14280 [Desulfamplus sp.]|nr:hypothetical protein [Desulfamplus sp.]
MKEMSAAELREYRAKEHEKSYLLIDVRQPVEYEESHIPGSILLPLNVFEEQVEELPEKNLIFYCRSGIRSRAAALTADFFNEAGKDIYSLEGGVLAWNGVKVKGLPSLQLFDFNKPIGDILYDAINFEKGAFRFYEHIVRHFELKRVGITTSFNTVIVDVMKQARDGELGHAKLIYSHLKKLTPDALPFDDVYAKSRGDILEGGATFDELIELIENRSDDHIIDILEIAISMEYRAFDLYRVMSERTEEEPLKEAFYSLAQAEKSHMNTLANALEQSVPTEA